MNWKEESYPVFEMFEKQWALVTAGTLDNYDGCTIGWGSLGNIWNNERKIVTVYVNPSRYTSRYLLKNRYFTVSWFPEEYRDDLKILGSKSGRDGDKFALTKLTPYAVENGVAFKEAELTFVCRKLYESQFDRSKLDASIADGIYKHWEPHYEFIGEIVETIQ